MTLSIVEIVNRREHSCPSQARQHDDSAREGLVNSQLRIVARQIPCVLCDT